ncbi:MAG: site-specific integrase [Candidatus Nanoarchaeia archaeon]|nr:site-specific integrase [Candidatus Nanoarchaeia archaeon]
MKLKYALKTETRYNEMNEKELAERQIMAISKNHIQKLMKEQQDVLNDYFEWLLANRSKNKSMVTIFNCIENIIYFAKDMNKPFPDIALKELVKYFSRLELPSDGKKPLKASSITLRMIYVRQFLKWFHNGKNQELTAWMKTTRRYNQKITNPSELLTAEDIRQMVEACPNERNSCIIMMLYEAGLRAGECGNIRIKDINETEQGFEIKVNGKTGERIAFFLDSVPYIKAWLNKHPFRSNPEAPLFINISKNQFGRQLLGLGISHAVRLAAKRANIKKRVYPHLFRHSMINMLGKEGWRERELRIFAGWTGTSNMPNVYLHYGTEEVRKRLFKRKGLIIEESEAKEATEKKILMPIVCPKCKALNASTAKYCTCGTALSLKVLYEDAEKRKEADGVMDKLFQDTEFKELVKEFLAKKIDKGIAEQAQALSGVEA